eukprot:gi/632985504/ref/XP_007909718.1/ PREDICTED: chymotrypsin-like protease CTRL-1 [Callorhinchus milii]
MPAPCLLAILVWASVGWASEGSHECGERVTEAALAQAGDRAGLGEFPWQVSLTHSGQHQCGGSLISHVWIVTGARCVSNRAAANLSVQVGLVDLKGQKVSHEVGKIICHEDYEPLSSRADIALLQLRIPVKFSNSVSAVCFPDNNFLDPQEIQNCWVSGWSLLSEGPGSHSQFLQKLRTHYVNRTQCAEIWGPRLLSSMICTHNPNPNCTGEAGGPLVCQDTHSQRWVLVGTRSLVEESCQPAEVHTSVAQFIDWIRRVTSAAGKPFIPFVPPSPARDWTQEMIIEHLAQSLNSPDTTSTQLPPKPQPTERPAKPTQPAPQPNSKHKRQHTQQSAKSTQQSWAHKHPTFRPELSDGTAQRAWSWLDRFSPETLAKRDVTSSGGMRGPSLLLGAACSALGLHWLRLPPAA